MFKMPATLETTTTQMLPAVATKFNGPNQSLPTGFGIEAQVPNLG